MFELLIELVEAWLIATAILLAMFGAAGLAYLGVRLIMWLCDETE